MRLIGPLIDEAVEEFLPANKEIRLRRDRMQRLLGVTIGDAEVSDIFSRLQMSVDTTDDGWLVTAPSHRFDIEIEADLIEEVARIHGYDSIPEETAVSRAPLQTVTESRVDFERVADTLIARDYQEVITYSFIDERSNELFSGEKSELVLSNPISTEMSVMRASLWPGMVAAAAANYARQQDRVRLFEISKSFHGKLGAHEEVLRIAGLASGPVRPEQWASPSENVDFFDIKADVQALLALSQINQDIRFETAEHVALQPGQTAQILRGEEVLGVVGKLHPRLAKVYDLKRPVYLFELDAAKTLQSTAPSASPVSKYPAIRRDVAVIVDDEISAQQLIDAVAASSPQLIREVSIFDIYTGSGIEAGRKSVAIGLILQETSRTLTDDDADVAMTAAIKNLEDQFAAVLRD